MGLWWGKLYVKSPVASLCLACSSVRKRVRVTMFVLIFSDSCIVLPLDAIATEWVKVRLEKRMRGGFVRRGS